MNKTNNHNEIAVFGGGCFWCTEAVFAQLKGVVSVLPGYTGGTLANPTYEEVCTGNTGHVEVSRIEYDPKIISFVDLLNVFFATHDPTTKDRQGNDTGSQYRSVIFYTNSEQQSDSHYYIHHLEREKIFGSKIVTEVRPLEVFYEAENYHKKYFQNNPDKLYCQIVISPKLAKLREKFKSIIQS